MKFSVFLFLILFLFSTGQLYAQSDCRALFDSNFKTSFEALEQKFNTKFQLDLRKDFHQEDVVDYSLRLKDAKDVYAIVVFAYYTKGKVLEIINMNTYEPYKNQGIGNFLMKRILHELPETQFIIAAGLSESNHEVIQDYMKKGFSKVEAIKQTPAYKIRARLGFSEIIEKSITKEDGFIVRKPKN